MLRAPLFLFLLPALLPGIDRQIRLEKAWSESVTLAAGETVEVSAGMTAPSALPVNGRVAVAWTAPVANASLRKVIHALDPDVYFVYRAPVAGKYVLAIQPVTDEKPLFNSPRWRESGIVPAVDEFPTLTPWPAGKSVAMRVAVKPVEFGTSARHMIVEVEPNNSLEQAQDIPLEAGNQDQTLHITGGADDIEYFDNGQVGDSGDDWFRIEYKGTEPRLFTANLTFADPLVAARLRFYTADHTEYKEGMNANERVHQQLEEHRTEINRILKPGGVYFLRAEANAPGYEIELRIRRPAPYTDPRDAIRQGLYDHLAQVDAWLMNRPRGASVERRIRDTGNLLGTGCMSCHTQSGVWGSAYPMKLGYLPENVQNFRHLINVMYESLRPTNFLKDAANNTSLAPYDLGDGPAGTRVAGHNVVTLEQLQAPRKLQSKQQIRTANFVLQSSDPGGINAAGPGSNVGQAVVYNYAGEILRVAWDKTHDAKYFEALEEKAEKMLGVLPKFTDDMAHRIEFFRNVFPRDYAALKGNTDEARSFMARVAAQLETDEARLRASQGEDGTWGFTPGVVDPKEDPAPTALAVWALAALGHKDDDPVVAKGVQALLRMQDPCGRWNKNALTGFVTTSYALHALARLYPETPAPIQRADFVPQSNESLNDTIARFRTLAQQSDPQFTDLILPGATHASPQVRYWAMIALGAAHSDASVAPLVLGLSDSVKMVREAARWGLRQALLDDRGWNEVNAAYAHGDDLTREQVAATLIMRADAVMTGAHVNFPRLTAMLDRMMNRDASPAVRAWSVRAAWNWWIWNPPVRTALNASFLAMLERPEPNVLVENAQRYQTQALFIANGHRANGTNEHQYLELAQLFDAISKKLDHPNPTLVKHIVAVAGTYYNMAGGDGGPGQLGYTTEHSKDMVGKAVVAYWNRAENRQNENGVRLALEAAAGASYEPLQKKLLTFAKSGPENLRPVAATSMSDPRFISLPGTQEFVEPLIEQVKRGAADVDRRDQLSKPVMRLFNRGHWNIPGTEEQQRLLFAALIPKLDDGKSESQQYLAEQLGLLLSDNPDLHVPVVLDLFPRTFRNRLEEYFWLLNVKWILTYNSAIPEVRGTAPTAPDSLADVRRRALELFTKQLSPGVEDLLRLTAVFYVPETAIRSNPEVMAALEKMEADPYKDFDKELHAAINADSAPGKPPMNATWMRNLAYFRDYVVPEMNRPNRYDEQACFGCHGVAGRVPSMELAAPARNGLIGAKDLWRDYRALLERVNETDVETSKLLRKPLNVQTGKEDGHQGGVRYKPDDRGYQIIRRWVLDTAALRKNGTGELLSRRP